MGDNRSSTIRGLSTRLWITSNKSRNRWTDDRRTDWRLATRRPNETFPEFVSVR